MEDIRLTEQSDASGGLILKQNVCLVCKKQTAQYTCPKCNIHYCSLACYKNHSEGCTNTFYQQNFAESLKNERATEEEKQRMLELLQKMHEQQQEEEDEEFPDNLSSLNLEDESSLSLASLTPEQLADFKKAIADGTLSELIEVWKPWWTFEENKRWKPLITVLGDEDKEMKDDKQPLAKVPTIFDPIPPLSDFLKKQPSPLLAFNLIDILYAYAFVQRLYNGEPQVEPVESLEEIMAVSSVFSNNAVHDSITSAIQTVLENSLKPGVSNTIEYSLSILKDVSVILTSKRFILLALSDLHALVSLALKGIAPKQGTLKKTLVAVQKKALFFISWASEQQEQVFAIVQSEVERIWQEKETLRQEGQKQQKKK